MINFLITPKIRMFYSLIFTILIGISCSLFATEIMQDGKIVWSNTFKTNSFWYLLVLVALWLIGNYYYYINDNKIIQEIMNFSDSKFCVAYIRKAKLEAIADKIKSDPDAITLYNADDIFAELGIDKK